MGAGRLEGRPYTPLPMAHFRVISIGTLAHHPLWGERGDVRPAHATTTLIDAGDAKILVDPSLPEQILVPRLLERSGLKPEAITHVFLTNFHPMRRRGITAFDDAQWLVGELERESVGAQLIAKFQEAEDADDGDLAKSLRAEITLLQRCKSSPDTLAMGVDLFPLYGVTQGSCGLLLPQPSATVLVAGDTVAGGALAGLVVVGQQGNQRPRHAGDGRHPHDGHGAGRESVEGSGNDELAIIVGGEVTEGCDLDIHRD